MRSTISIILRSLGWRATWSSNDLVSTPRSMQALRTGSGITCRDIVSVTLERARPIFDEAEFESFGIVGNFLDARQFVQAGGFGGMVATFTRNNVIGVFARKVPDQQRLEHALFADGIGEFAKVSEGFARLIGIRADFVRRNHAADRRAAETGQRFDVMRVMPHLESDG